MFSLSLHRIFRLMLRIYNHLGGSLCPLWGAKLIGWGVRDFENIFFLRFCWRKNLAEDIQLMICFLFRAKHAHNFNIIWKYNIKNGISNISTRVYANSCCNKGLCYSMCPDNYSCGKLELFYLVFSISCAWEFITGLQKLYIKVHKVRKGT